MPWQVKFFQNQRGDKPVEEFILQQEKTIYTRIIRLIDLIKDNGPLIRPPYAKKIRDNIWELRVSGKNAIRVLYCFINNEFYLLHIFKKKTDKTPAKEIKIAIDRAQKII